MSMKVREWKGDVVFLHEVGKGPADRSYGVAVARLAGLPDRVVARAEAILKLLEKQRRTGGGIDELPLFSAAQAPAPHAAEDTADANILAAALSEVEPDALTPRDALEVLYRLKSITAETKKK